MIKNLLLLLATLLICIFVGEITLRLFTPFPIHSGKNKVFDDRLLYVLDSRQKDVDETGFRNPAIPERVDFVAIGDSFTYGNNVPWHETWPYQLARMTGKSVYNLGVGSYGVYQYYELFTRALKFRPSHVLIAFYLPNDLYYKTCQLLRLPYWRDLAAEFGLDYRHCIDDAPLSKGAVPGNKLISGLRAIIPDSAIRSAITYFRREYFPRAGKLHTISNGTSSIFVRKKAIANRSKKTDLNEPGIAQNLANSKVLFERMVKTASDHNVTLGIVFIPSIATVSYEWALKEGVEVPGEIVALAENEKTLLKIYRDFFDERGVGAVDAMESILAALNESAAGGNPVFKIDGDGHPLAVGYAAYARAALELLK